MNIKVLPNYPALIALCQRYQENRATKVQTGSSHISSHWQIYSKASQIAVDNGGNLVYLEGKGFGGYEQARLLKRLGDYLCCAIHFLLGDNKRRKFNLSRNALSLIRKIPFGHHYLSYDLFRQIDALATIMQYCHIQKSDRFIVLVIGDGYGFLAALVKNVYPHARIVLVDIGSTLLFQCLYLQVLYPEKIHDVVGFDTKGIGDQPDVDFMYCPAEKLEQLQYGTYRLAINVCSMQEMNKVEVERYFRHLRVHAGPESLFYCCNRESKVLPDGEEIKFEAFPWLSTDRHLINGYPSTYRFWFSAKLRGNGPKWYGIRIPFLDGPDGPVRHRLSFLSGHTGCS